MQDKKGEGSKSLYNLTHLRPQSLQLAQYQQLVALLHSQIDLLNNLITQLNHTLSTYHQSANNLAQILHLQLLPIPSTSQTLPTLKTWLQNIQDAITTRIRNTVTQKPYLNGITEHIVEVDRPVFIERMVEVQRPVMVQRPVFVDRIVEVQRPIFVQKKIYVPCPRCLEAPL